MSNIKLSDIEVGTEVVVVDTGNGWGTPTTTPDHVFKITKHYIELSSGRRYKIAGRDWNEPYISDERKSPGHYVSDRSYTTLRLASDPILKAWEAQEAEREGYRAAKRAARLLSPGLSVEQIRGMAIVLEEWAQLKEAAQ